LPLLLGESPALVELRRDIQAAARTEAKVLILGETGVGKEVVAQLIHAQSPRVSRPFVAVNCSAIPETLLESELFGHVRGSFTGAYRDKPGLVRQADHGTLFLDEVGEMSLRMQAVLLRFAETGEIQPIGSDSVTGRTDVRLITATNRDLRKQIEAALFREDLYYRLNVFPISVPPLRQRGEDVLLLLRYYLQRASEAHRLPIPELTPDAEGVLLPMQLAGQHPRTEEPDRAAGCSRPRAPISGRPASGSAGRACPYRCRCHDARDGRPELEDERHAGPASRGARHRDSRTSCGRG
jgi:transcriptional regulator with GAF, ATPase, and Fis domain